MKIRYLFSIAFIGLLWTACSSDRSDKTHDTVALDSPAVSDSLGIKAADADSTAKDNVRLDTMNR